MSFMYQKTHNGDFEVIMQKGTIPARPNIDRRFALCTHENDAETIVDALNAAESAGVLRE